MLEVKSTSRANRHRTCIPSPSPGGTTSVSSYALRAQLEVRPRPLRDRREAVLLLFLHAFGGGVFNVREVFSIAQLLRIRATGAELLETQI